MSDRREAILGAACRVIARTGMDRLRMSDVAREAKVSTALVHYYCATRDELLQQAFAYSEERSSEMEAEVSLRLTDPIQRLEGLLTLYLSDDPAIHQSWILWHEVWSHALFRADLRPPLTEAYRVWISSLAEPVRAAQATGAVPAAVDAEVAARRLSALVDGLGPQVMNGIFDRLQCVELVRQAISMELRIAGTSDRAA